MARKGGTPANLIPAKKGEVRNPHGRPVGTRNRITIVKQWIEANHTAINPLTGKEETLQLVDHLVLKQISKALKESDTTAFKELMDSCFGKIVDSQKIEHSGNLGITVNLEDGTDA